MADRVDVEGLHVTLMNAATAVSDGAALTLPVPLSRFTSQALVTGTPTTVSVKLQGSLNGVDWVDMTTHAGAGWQHFVAGPTKYVRASLVTLTGGTAPTVTLLVAGTN